MSKEFNRGWVKAELFGQLVTPPPLADAVWFVSPDNLNVQECTNAIIVYWAPWSAPFVKVWNELTARFAENKIPIEILLIHYDHWKNPLCTTFFGAEVGGWGEICWVYDGHIVARDVYGKLQPGVTWAERLNQMDRRLQELAATNRNT